VPLVYSAGEVGRDADGLGLDGAGLFAPGSQLRLSSVGAVFVALDESLTLMEFIRTLARRMDGVIEDIRMLTR